MAEARCPTSGATVLFCAGRVAARVLPDIRGKWRLEQFLRRLADSMVLPEEIVVRTLDGFRIQLHPADYLQREIYLFGDWEREIAQRMCALLHPGEVAIDVGSNIGYLTLHAARLVGPGGRVLGFEPNPACYAQLQTNVALNGFTQIETYPIALGDRQGQMLFYPDGGNNSGAGSLLQRSDSAPPIDVAIDVLDAILERHPALPGRIALVKIDVEGFEMSVLGGMTGLLSAADGPAIICEISEWSLEKNGTSHQALFDKMVSHGYDHEVISPKSRSILAGGLDYFQYDALFRKRK